MKIPYFRQNTEYTCGPAAMRMALGALGIVKSERQLSLLLHTNSMVGTRRKAFPLLAERLLLDYVVERESSIEDIKEAIASGFIVIVNYFYTVEQVPHFAVVKRIDSNRIYLLDPEAGPGHSYPLAEFISNWHSGPSREKGKRWFFGIRK